MPVFVRRDKSAGRGTLPTMCVTVICEVPVPRLSTMPQFEVRIPVWTAPESYLHTHRACCKQAIETDM